VHAERSELALSVVDIHCPPSMLTVGVGLLGGFVRNSKHPAFSTDVRRAIAHNRLVMTEELLPAGPAARSVSL
jgi:hypothetical protein